MGDTPVNITLLPGCRSQFSYKIIDWVSPLNPIDLCTLANGLMEVVAFQLAVEVFP
jgi:hypothetical protein